MKYLTLITAILLASFVACKQSSTHNSNQKDSTPADTLKYVTYLGTLPCADCSGIITKLTIDETDSVGKQHFKLTETYQGTKNGDQDLNSEGRYAIIKGSASDPNAVVIVLNPDKDKNLQRYFQKISEDELRLLDGEQKAINSNLNYSLKRQ
ncbi:copper resistance protein NlpE [Chitinophaga sp. Hz27]|uniref:copper resistance protein NlpE n=1 Tax=Chitinophaga sp. Hz27 TaxID=3347169 RepID=UPI0035DB3F1B